MCLNIKEELTFKCIVPLYLSISNNYNYFSTSLTSELLSLQSEKGILYRQIRSIQTEGSFGDMKHNDDFNRFNHKSTEKVYKEVMFYVFGRNIMKYHRFRQGTLKEYTGKAA